MTTLLARGVVAGYGSRIVLGGVDVAAAAGERVALVGPNGAGKTTLLRVLAGALAPRAGAVSLDGAGLDTFTARERARRIAVVPQRFATPFAFTAREIVALGRTPHVPLFGRMRAPDRAAVERALADTEARELAERPFAELSGGERQRIVLAMALAQEGEVLLLDEPTTHLDLAHQLRILGLVERLAVERGLVVVAALHDVALAARHFDRMVALDNGAIVADGTARAVLTARLLRDVFDVEASVQWHDGCVFVIPDEAERGPARSLA